MPKTVREIKSEFEMVDEIQLRELVQVYAADPRAGVQALIARQGKKAQKLQAERKRMYGMFFYERKYGDTLEPGSYLCGIDEAGRGPLAGPVTAAAVILNPEREILYLDDSKKLTEKMREQLYDEIMEKAICVGVGWADWQQIDAVNILQATYQAMREAVGHLSIKPSFLLNDHVIIPDIGIRQIGIDHGDALSASIAAASVIAKVTRDRKMREYDKQYPGYGFAKHKGYGTAEHIEAIRRFGPSPIHRKTFIIKYMKGVADGRKTERPESAAKPK